MAIIERSTQRNTTTAATTSVTFTFPSAPLAGNLVVMAFSWRGDATVTAVPFSSSLARNGGNGSGIDSAIYYKIASGTEGTTWTFTLSTAQKSAGVATEYSGVANPALDVVNSNTATGTAGSTGLTGTLAGTGELVVALFSNININTWSAYSGGLAQVGQFASTGGSNATRNNTALAAGIATATTSTNYTATLSGSQIWSSAVATFKVAPEPVIVTVDRLTSTQTLRDVSIIAAESVSVDRLTSIQTLRDVMVWQSTIVPIDLLVQSQLSHSVNVSQSTIVLIDRLNQTLSLQTVDIVAAEAVQVDRLIQTQVLHSTNVSQSTVVSTNLLVQTQTLYPTAIVEDLDIQVDRLNLTQVLHTANIKQDTSVGVENFTVLQTLYDVGLSYVVAVDLQTLTQTLLDVNLSERIGVDLLQYAQTTYDTVATQDSFIPVSQLNYAQTTLVPTVYASESVSLNKLTINQVLLQPVIQQRTTVGVELLQCTLSAYPVELSGATIIPVTPLSVNQLLHNTIDRELITISARAFSQVLLDVMVKQDLLVDVNQITFTQTMHGVSDLPDVVQISASFATQTFYDAYLTNPVGTLITQVNVDQWINKNKTTIEILGSSTHRTVGVASNAVSPTQLNVAIDPTMFLVSEIVGIDVGVTVTVVR